MNELFYFFRNQSFIISQQCDNHFTRIVVARKNLLDHRMRLSEKQDNIIKGAKHFLKVLEAGDPTSILVDICSAWEKWEEVCTAKPKKQNFSISGFVTSVFSESNYSEESNLVRHLKKMRRQIGITARNRLERIFINLDAVSQDFNIAHLCNMTKYILFFVEFISCAEQKMGFTMWVLNPPIKK